MLMKSYTDIEGEREVNDQIQNNSSSNTRKNLYQRIDDGVYSLSGQGAVPLPNLTLAALTVRNITRRGFNQRDSSS